MKQVVIFLSSILLFCAITIYGHTVPKEEVIGYINSNEVREAAGVERASSNEKIPRLLIVEVNEKWFKVSPDERRGFAKKWYTMWRHSVPNGTVSIIDKDKGEPVVHFFPDGRAELTK